MTKDVMIIGAGLAGLAAATELSAAGLPVRLFEASPHAGGRCRSFFDSHLEQVIDNGNHLVLSGNRSVSNYCNRIGADGWHCFDHAHFPFFDLATGEAWTVDMGHGRLPSWIFKKDKRALGTSWQDYLPALKIMLADPSTTVADIVDKSSPAYERFWEPLTLAIVNTPLDQAAAVLLKSVFRETMMKGGHACRPMIAKQNLDDALIAPALSFLGQKGVQLHFAARASALAVENERITRLKISGESVSVSPNTEVILACPAWEAAKLLPALDPPIAGEGILNIHYRVSTGLAAPQFKGLVSSLAQWVFLRGDCVSVTVSAAGRAMAQKPDALAQQCWTEVAKACGLPSDFVPPYRVIKEKRATFDQSPAGLAKRKGPVSFLKNLSLAGDWTDHRIPATIECAVRSGHAAAQRILSKNRV